ncbi:MAG: hypothetical protein P8L79_06800 [Rhodospirillaceae bacterium]|nr:hypothetical protein [Rhodospirillaceae bacterium]
MSSTLIDLAQLGLNQVAYILLHGTTTKGGIFMLNRDADRIIQECKKAIQQAERLKGKYVGTDESVSVAVTAYHPRRNKRKRILRGHR